MKLIGYYGSWNLYANPRLIPTNTTTNITHFSYSFMNFKSDGNIVLGDPWADVQISLGTSNGDSSPLKKGYLGGNLHNMFRLKKLNRHIKTGIEYGGATFSTNISSVLNNQAYSTNFANGVKSQVNNFGLDYIGLDFEGSFNTTNMPNLLSKVKTAIGTNVSIFYSLSGSFYNYYSQAIITSMDPYINTWNLMCIDFAGPWTQTNNVLSNNLYPECDTLVQLLLDYGVPSNKIVIEAQIYARPSGPSEYGDSLTYQSTKLKEFETAFGTFYNSTAVSQYTYDSNGVMWSYDSIQSVQDKLNYIANKSLGGISFWMLGNDRKANESLINFAFQNMQNLDKNQSNLNYPTSIYTNIKTSSLA